MLVYKIASSAMHSVLCSCLFTYSCGHQLHKYKQNFLSLWYLTNNFQIL